jgi:hypothetical protein
VPAFLNTSAAMGTVELTGLLWCIEGEAIGQSNVLPVKR